MYREDIALLFPGYLNSIGAGGYFYLDTTQYANGVHTNQWQGFQVIGGRLGTMPVGSTFDRKKGIFYWQPGPGFVGEYRFLFIQNVQQGNVTRTNIIVEIIPYRVISNC